MEKKTKKICCCVCGAVLAVSCAVGAIALTDAGQDNGQNTIVASADAAYYVKKEDSSVSYAVAPVIATCGLYAQLVPNDSLTLKNVIDLEELGEKGESFVEFSACVEQAYNAEYTRIRLEMIDVYDESNYVTVQISADPQLENSAGTSYFLACASNGQKLSGYEENKNLVHVNNEYGAWSPFSFCGIWGSSDYTGLYYDVTKKAIYAVSNMGARKMIIDFDDPVHFGTYLWDGFTSNEVYCRISCDKYKTDAAKLLVRKYGNFDLSNPELDDRVAPVLDIQYGEYSEENVPNALVGKAYPVFPVTAFDAVDGVVDADVKVYMNYYSSQKLEVRLKNGAFTPQISGPHYIVYSSVDSRGNTVEKVLRVNAQDSCEPLSIRFENVQDTCVEGDKYAFPAYEISGGLGKLALSVSASLNGKTLAIEDGGVRPYESGTLKIKYALQDYIGQTYETEQEIAVTDAVKPTFIEEPILPKYLIAGNRYTLPALNAYDYVTAKGSPISTAISVKENGNSCNLTNNVYVPSDVSQAEIVYTAKIGNATAEYCKVLPVYSVTNSDGLDMAKYFVYGANGASVATPDAVNLIASADEKFEFINYVTALSFRTGFSLGENYTGVKKFHILLTDIKNENKVLKFTYTFEGKTAYFYLNDKEDGKVSVDGALEAEKRFRLNLNTLENKVFYDIKNNNVLPVNTFMDGTPYTGFTKSRAYVTYYFEGVSEETTIGINDINSGYLSDETEDWIKPILAWNGDVGGQKEINSTLKLPQLLANDVLSGDIDAYVTIKAPSGNIITDLQGRVCNNFLYDGTDIAFILAEYGDYLVTVTAMDASGNKTTSSTLISVIDTEKPVLHISGSIALTGKVGQKISLPKATAKDNYSEASISVYVVYPTSEILDVSENVDGFVASVAGTYTVVYSVSDAAGNFVTEYYKITVTEGN